MSSAGHHDELSCCLAPHYSGPVSVFSLACLSPSLPLELSTSSYAAHGLLEPHNCQETCGLPGAICITLPLVVLNLAQFQLFWRYTVCKNLRPSHLKCVWIKKKQRHSNVRSKACAVCMVSSSSDSVLFFFVFYLSVLNIPIEALSHNNNYSSLCWKDHTKKKSVINI